MRKLVSILLVAALLMCSSVFASADFQSGTYEEEMVGHNGNVKLAVTFGEKWIESIDILECEESKQLGDVAIQTIADEIICKQSLNVDALAGATISSMTAKALITQAVKDAGGDPADYQSREEVDMSALPDETVDMVIVGAGAAGMAAACEAADLGLNVILVEKLGVLGGSSMRAGGIHGAETSILEKYGMEYTHEQFYDMLTAPLSENLDPETLDIEYCKIASERWGENIEWLADLGVEFGEPWGGCEHWDTGAVRNAWRLIKAMHEHMDELNVDYRLNSKAESLIIENGVVKGIVVTAPNGTQYRINAKGVVLCTGGFLANKDLVAEYLPGQESFTFDESIGCTGDGLIMALEAGADTKAMDSAGMHGLATLYRGISRSLTMPAHSGAIAVNAKGERFANEDGAYADLTAAVKAQGDVWCIMDEATFTAPAVATDVGGNPDMYVICDTLEELAYELGIDAEGLKATAERYGEFVHNKVDEDFGKAENGLVGDYSVGPFYGLKAVVENHTNYGGIATDLNARVLNKDGEAIEGLFAAGEVACLKTPGRGPLSEAIDLGRIAARFINSDING